MSEIKSNKISPRKGTTQTIGDSGDTVTISSGATLSNAGTISTAGISGGTINNTTGTISGLRGQVEWDTTAKTTAFTAEANRGYFVNTTSSAITVTFPTSPTAGDVIGLKDYANTFDTNSLTLNPNGNKIQGSTSNFDCTDEGAALQFIYVDSTRGWVLTDASKASDIVETPSFITATGGTETTCGDYKIHTFTGPGTLTVTQIGNAPTIPTGGPNTIDYMVVAGGGGGGLFGGGGGAGGWRASDGTNSGCYSAGPAPLVGCVSGVTASITAYPITVGAGGGAGEFPAPSIGCRGSNSIFSTITSTGGGGGAAFGNRNNVDGGSGAGGKGATPTPNAGGSGNTPSVSPPQGNSGGSGATGDPFSTGAGGGSGGGGGNAGPNNVAGNGGNGVPSSISTSAVTYAGGGGGGSRPSSYPATAGSGGTGGGGAGGQGTVGTNGTANTGGGGGGGGQETPSFACQAGGSGGSGIVIIRYKYQ